MIKQILSNEIKEYIKNNPKCILLDVRTKKEWNEDGKPDGDKVGAKTYFLSISADFVKEFKNLNVDKNFEILTLCASGVRSQIACEILAQENYSCINILDGFLGNQKNIGWKNFNLPCK